MTRIRTEVAAATTQSTNHYTITARQPHTHDDKRPPWHAFPHSAACRPRPVPPPRRRSRSPSAGLQPRRPAGAPASPRGRALTPAPWTGSGLRPPRSPTPAPHAIQLSSPGLRDATRKDLPRCLLPVSRRETRSCRAADGPQSLLGIRVSGSPGAPRAPSAAEALGDVLLLPQHSQAASANADANDIPLCC